MLWYTVSDDQHIKNLSPGSGECSLGRKEINVIGEEIESNSRAAFLGEVNGFTSIQKEINTLVLFLSGK